MMKYTTKNYKKKYVTYGIIAFAGVALMSTGFATWLFINNVEETAGGNVNVGTVVDGNIAFEGVTLGDNQNIVFDVAENDTTGDIRTPSAGTALNLDLKIIGKISPAAYVDYATIQMTLPEGVWKAAGYKKLENGNGYTKDSNLKEYITLPTITVGGETKEIATEAQRITLTDTTEEVDGANIDKKTFDVDISFDWGAFFGNENPSLYLDGDTVSHTKEEKKTILNTFISTLKTGSTENPTDPTDIGKFEVTLTAIAKA